MPAARFAIAAATALVLAACTAGEAPEAAGTGDAAGAPATGTPAPAPTDTAMTGTPSATATPTGTTTAESRGDVDSNPPGDACGASQVAPFVSMEATPKVRADLAAKVGHGRIRWIGPDTMVTMDFRADRLNVTLDENNVITGGKCQ